MCARLFLCAVARQEGLPAASDPHSCFSSRFDSGLVLLVVVVVEEVVVVVAVVVVVVVVVAVVVVDVVLVVSQ